MMYLNEEVLNEFLISTSVIFLLLNHLVLGLLVELLHEGVDSPHLVNSDDVLLSTLLNPQLNLVLLKLVLIVLSQSLLLFCDILLLLDCELVLCLLGNGSNSLLSVRPDEGNHGLEHLC